jgi:YYY domain-containing protein
MSEIIYPIYWWLAILLLSLSTYPLTQRLLPALKDTYGFSKLFSVLLLTYLSWLLSYLTGYTRGTVIVVFLAIFSLTALLFKQRKLPQLFIFHEILFTVSFLSLTTVRSFYPEINGAEKFMDFAILNAIFNTQSFPPLDPWLAGEHLDFYYYFGQLTVASIAKLTGTPPEIAYNLGLALFFSLATVTAASIGFNLTGRKTYALLTVFFAVISGNLKSVVLALKMAYYGFSPNIAYYWDSSRVIPYTANEFPSFTFLHGDLHAHLAAIPLQLLTILTLLNLYRCCNKNQLSINTSVLTGFILGLLFPTHSWDYPTYLFITTLIVTYTQGLKKMITALSIIVTTSLLYLAPFYLDFTPAGINGLGIVSTHTRIQDYLLVFGLALFSITLFTLQKATLKQTSPLKIIYLLPITAILFFISHLLNFHLLAPLLILLTLCFLILKNNTAQKSQKTHNADTADVPFVVILLTTGLLVSLFCEVLYFNDAFTHPLERFNTVFKLYIQIWILFAITATYAVYHLTPRISKGRSLWLGMLAIIILSGLIYPTTTALIKTDNFSGNPSLDGIAYLKQNQPGDYYAIKWMRTHLPHDSVVLERWGKSYTLAGRISANTGIPTVIGWGGHEIMWRSNSTLVNQRLADVDRIYTSQNLTQTIALINKYNITHIYVGSLEKQRYQDKILKFENKKIFKPIYVDIRNSTRLYEVSYDNP